MNKAERTERINSLGRLALRLARRGGIRGYVEIEGEQFGVFEFAHNELSIDELRATAVGVPSRAEVRWLGAKVLSIEWADRQITKAIFKPGEWEKALQLCADR